MGIQCPVLQLLFEYQKSRFRDLGSSFFGHEINLGGLLCHEIALGGLFFHDLDLLACDEQDFPEFSISERGNAKKT